MMEYNKMISDKIRENELKMIRAYPQPMMFGGVRFLNGHPQASGNNYANPSTLATGSEFFEPSGGNLTKQLQKMSKSAVKDVGKLVNKTSRAVVNDIPNMVSKSINSSVVPALSKYGEKALTNYLAPAIEEGAEVAVGMGRRRGRPRKQEGGSFKSVMKQVNKVGKQIVNKAIPMAEKYAANAVMDYALPAVETGAEFVAANPEVLLLAAGRKRKGRFAKGSKEAKEWGEKMKKIREMKK